jgi:hypothetical protein
MTSKTRDNLIYVAVGLGIAALVSLDFFYSDSHHRKEWVPSRFAFRAVTTPSLLAYFVVREMLEEKARFFQIVGPVLFATLVQLGIMFSFRQIIDQLPGMTYSALAVMDIFIVWLMTIQVAQYLSSPNAKKTGRH